MNESSNRTSMHAVDAWIRYIEHFGSTDVSVQKLINYGYEYREIIRLFENALEKNVPLKEESFSEYKEIV